MAIAPLSKSGGRKPLEVQILYPPPSIDEKQLFCYTVGGNLIGVLNFFQKGFENVRARELG